MHTLIFKTVYIDYIYVVHLYVFFLCFLLLYVLHINALPHGESCPQFYSEKYPKSMSPRLIRPCNNG